ncbi:MAG: hypothetical protein V1754_08465 [Pseudomonadota bacterium]
MKLHKRITIFSLLAAWLLPASVRGDIGLNWDVHGYYRNREVIIHNLANEIRPPWPYFDEETRKDIGQPYRQAEWTTYLMQRVRLEPILSFRDLVKLQLTVDALDNVVWGDNDSLSSSPIFAGEGTNSGYRGDSPSIIALRRAWIELDLKVGKLRVGRMASHWGMGLLSHGGGTFDGAENYRPRDFGDYNFGSIYDRVLFATKPVSVIKTLFGAKDTESNIIFAYAFDKLVEDPLELDLPRNFYRPLGESGWLSNDGDDVNEHVFILVYKNEELEIWDDTDQLVLGAYGIIRTQTHSYREDVKDEQGNVIGSQYTGDGSLIPIADLWGKLRLGPIDFETEWFAILGKTDGGIPMGGGDLLKKDIRIFSGAIRLGYLTEWIDGVFEFGYSSGDDDLSDGTFSQRPSHPDYNVGLLLYEEILRERTARTLGRKLSYGLQSNGGVVNSSYMFPRVRYRPWPWFEGIFGVLSAWTNQPTRQAGLYDKNRGNFLGTEFDLSLTATWAKAHLFFALETGYLIFGDALKDAYLKDGVMGAYTLQSRLYFVF